RECGCLNHTATAARFPKDQPIVEPNFVGHADTSVKVFQIRAATERNMLAIVDVLTVGENVGRRAATQSRTFFEQRNAEAGAGESNRCSEPRKPPTDDD